MVTLENTLIGFDRIIVLWMLRSEYFCVNHPEVDHFSLFCNNYMPTIIAFRKEAVRFYHCECRNILGSLILIKKLHNMFVFVNVGDRGRHWEAGTKGHSSSWVLN